VLVCDRAAWRRVLRGVFPTTVLREPPEKRSIAIAPAVQFKKFYRTCSAMCVFLMSRLVGLSTSDRILTSYATSRGKQSEHGNHQVSPRQSGRIGLRSVPAVIADAGDKATRRFLEFFTANIRNKNTRLAYARAVARFLTWYECPGFQRKDIEPMVAVAYVEQLQEHMSAPQRRSLCGRLLRRRR
jgi:hypothetical protein